MINLESIDGVLNKAFDLACFIQRDRDSAVRIVEQALAKLEVVATAQGKRLYYRPSGRRWSPRSSSERFRNRISFSEPHLFQRLIYIESERYEIAQEQADGPSAAGEEDLVIHFVKHLIRKTIKRNSFYVALGLGRLLHNYTTSETMDIYNAVIQNPERVKDDYYYRSRKGALMQELKERFGDLIKVCHGPRGEERFESDDNPGRFAQLVRECLSVFTPWNTPCLVPAGIDPIREGIPALSFRGLQDEDEVEVNRIHAVVHPDCFHRLITDLRFDDPDKRLNVPRFFCAKDLNGNGSSRTYSTTLNDEELRAISRELDENAARRKSTRAGMVRVMVDGSERARFDLSETRNTSFQIDGDAEMIEVLARDDTGEETLLALHPLAYAEADDEVQPANSSITLEGGQKISIVVSSVSRESRASVDITYRETSPFRAGALFFQQLGKAISSNSSPLVWNDRRIVVPALAILLLSIGLVAIVRYARKGNAPPGQQNQVASTQQPSAPSGNEAPTTGNATGEKTPSASETARQQGPTVGPSSNTGNMARSPAQLEAETKTPSETLTETGTETRSTKSRLTDLQLSSVKKIYVEIVGDETSKQTLREAVSESLRSSGGITLVSNRDEADALLQLSTVKAADNEPQTTVVVELINRRGHVIWPNANSGKYKGTVAEIGARLVKNLVAAIQESRRHP